MNKPWEYKGQTHAGPKLEFTKCTKDDVVQLVKKINIHKSSGVPKISARVLKDTLLTLPYHITFIINLALESSVFPDDWKKATVTPLPKEGDSSNVNNLRPISILPLPAKLTEKLIHKQIMTHLNDNNILTTHQDGFRPKDRLLTAYRNSLTIYTIT